MTNYEKELAAQASIDITKAIKILNNIDHNFYYTEEVEVSMLHSIVEMLQSIRDSLYTKSREE